MARIGVPRASAEPMSASQRERRRRILRSASRLAADKSLEHVQMHEVAKDAGVAIATVYRYFPSKTHLFTGVLADQISRLDAATPGPPPGQSPVDAVYELLVVANRRLLERPTLTMAMLRSQASHVGTAADGDRVDEAFRRLIFRTLGIDVPSPRDLVIVRLLLLSWHGILHLAISGRLSPSEAESDLRVACELLVPGSSALQTAATQTAAIRTRARPGPSR